MFGWNGWLDLNVFFGDRSMWDKYVNFKSNLIFVFLVFFKFKCCYGYRVDDL